MDTQNDGLEKVTPFKHSNSWYQFVRFLGCKSPQKIPSAGTWDAAACVTAEAASALEQATMTFAEESPWN